MNDDNDMNMKWSLSTIKIFLDNTNGDNAPDLLFNKEHMENLLLNTIEEHSDIRVSFSDTDEKVQRYCIAIQDFIDWIPNCK